MQGSGLTELLEQHGIVVSDSKMRRLYQEAVSLAEMNTTILIRGESGVGKDRLAKFIHAIGHQDGAPFIHINCSAVPAKLFESELFGYESGTFTGGLSNGKRGLLEAAQDGTLFLDEIGEMSLPNQVKLLDFLQTKQVTRLGSGVRKKLNVRIISATNRDIKQQISAGSFREDLYYRLCVVEMKIPPLRERPSDVAAFSNRFIHQFRSEATDSSLSPDAVAYLQSCDWPGNLRELQNFMERVCILESSSILTRDILEQYYQKAPRFAGLKPPSDSETPTYIPPLREAVAQFERNIILQAMAETRTLNDAAIRLGIDLDTLNRKKRKLGIYKRWKK